MPITENGFAKTVGNPEVVMQNRFEEYELVVEYATKTMTVCVGSSLFLFSSDEEAAVSTLNTNPLWNKPPPEPAAVPTEFRAFTTATWQP